MVLVYLHFPKKLPQHFREVSLPDIHFVPLIVCWDSCSGHRSPGPGQSASACWLLYVRLMDQLHGSSGQYVARVRATTKKAIDVYNDREAKCREVRGMELKSAISRI